MHDCNDLSSFILWSLFPLIQSITASGPWVYNTGPLDTHLRDLKYLVTQPITAPRQRGGGQDVGSSASDFQSMRQQLYFLLVRIIFSNSKACACLVWSPQTLFQAAPDSCCLTSWLPAMAQAGGQSLKHFWSIFLKALRSFLFWPGCQSSRPPSPSPLKDTPAVPSSLWRWSSK